MALNSTCCEHLVVKGNKIHAWQPKRMTIKYNQLKGRFFLKVCNCHKFAGCHLETCNVTDNQHIKTETESFCYKFAWRVEEVKMFGLGDSVNCGVKS